MAESITNPKISIQVGGVMANTLDDASAGSLAHPAANISPTLENGVGAGQCNRAWQTKAITIAQNAQQTISLYDFPGLDIGAGAGRDALGQLLAFEEIVCIVITNDNVVGAAGILEVLPANSEGWTPIGTHTVATGGALRGQGGIVKFQTAEAGFDIDSNTNHRITLRAVSGPVTYSMFLLARHDDDESSSSSSSLSSSSDSSSSSPSSISASSISTSSSSISTSSSSISTSSISSKSSISTSSSNSSSSLSSQS